MSKLLNEPSRVNVIGIPISAVNLKMALEFIENNLNDIRGEYICASNAHTTVMAHDDKHYKTVQSASIMSLPDGKPLAIIGQKKGYKSMKKTTGLNFMKAILSSKKLKSCRHYFYGNTKENIDLMIKNIKNIYPELNICGYEPSIFKELTNEEINDLAKRIDNAKADFVWIGLGAPRQEILMYKLKNKTNSIMIGVGGVFNILAGIINDAPDWMQKAGLEWLYRLLKEPKRLFKRYLITNTKFILYNMREKNEN